MKISYRKKRSLRGYAFISVWLLGTLLWFIIPVISSAGYSFFEFNPSDRNAERQWQGLDNYIYAFTADASYSEYLWKSVRETAVMTPLIVIFSLFSAVLLNHKFKGRSFAAAVFFIPVIVASGPVYNIISDDIAKAVTDRSVSDIYESFLISAGIYDVNSSFLSLAEKLSSQATELIWYSGIQILIFTVSLGMIPKSAEEIALIEGATSWEYFWKVVIPYISPAITANIVFTVINTFTYQNNKVIRRILDMQAEWNYGKASAMAWSYFIIVLVFTVLFILIIKKIFRWEGE